MVQHMGQHRWDQMSMWIRRVAGERMTYDQELNTSMRKWRLNLSAAVMGFKATVSLQNFSNVSNAMEAVTPWMFARAVAHMVAHPIATYRDVNELSGMMLTRFENLDRDIRSGMGRAANIFESSTKWSRGEFMVRQAGYSTLIWTDMLTAYPLWIAAHQDGLIESNNDADYARRYADSKVLKTLGMGGPKDLANFHAHPEETWKWMTVFYSWFSNAYCRFRSLGHDMAEGKGRQEGRMLAGYPWYMGRALAFWVIPAMAAELMADRGPDEDDEWLKWAAIKVAEYPFLTVPVVRDVSNLITSSMTGHGQRDIKYGPMGRILEDSVFAAMKFYDEVASEEDFEMMKVLRHGLKVAGYWRGLPTGQADIPLHYMYDLSTGKEEPKNVLEFMRYMTFRRRPDSKRKKKTRSAGMPRR